MFYVLDLLKWEDTPYFDFPLCSRLHFLRQKFTEIDQSIDSPYKFEILEMKIADLKGIREAYYGDILSQYVDDSGNLDKSRVLAELSYPILSSPLKSLALDSSSDPIATIIGNIFQS